MSFRKTRLCDIERKRGGKKKGVKKKNGDVRGWRCLRICSRNVSWMLMVGGGGEEEERWRGERDEKEGG